MFPVETLDAELWEVSCRYKMSISRQNLNIVGRLDVQWIYLFRWRYRTEGDDLHQRLLVRRAREHDNGVWIAGVVD